MIEATRSLLAWVPVLVTAAAFITQRVDRETNDISATNGISKLIFEIVSSSNPASSMRSGLMLVASFAFLVTLGRTFLAEVRRGLSPGTDMVDQSSR
jgi:hypothetical protein